MASRHGVTLSERHLKRILRNRGHSRQKDFSDLAVLVDFITTQLRGSGQLHGYRWIYAKCRESGLRVRKEDVRIVLRELDYNVPEGSTLDSYLEGASTANQRIEY
ncbi:hypothetical protein WMY93_006444 [Mugilogobius chulae]|uniref:Uncharacterized protein n=1 Tax=Mugilogobius chulae TaxID=88201 RepID=A0AAW0PU32_9GOBI